MLGLSLCTVIDLVPTTGTVGSDDDLFPCFLDGRKQFKSPHLHTHPIMFLFIPKGTCHPATARRNYGNLIVPGQIEDIKSDFLIGHRFLMAMGMDLYGFSLVGKPIGRNCPCR